MTKDHFEDKGKPNPKLKPIPKIRSYAMFGGDVETSDE